MTSSESEELIDDVVACAHRLSLVLNSAAPSAPAVLAGSMQDVRRQLDALVAVAAATALHPSRGVRAEDDGRPRLRLVR